MLNGWSRYLIATRMSVKHACVLGVSHFVFAFGCECLDASISLLLIPWLPHGG